MKTGGKIVTIKSVETINGDVNQNAFSKVNADGTVISSTVPVDTLNFISGEGITLTPDSTNKSLTISSDSITYEAATDSTLGLVKSGTSVSVDAQGNMTVNPAGHQHTIAEITNLNIQLNSKIETSQIGLANGVAGLDETGKVPADQLPELGVQLGETADTAYYGDKGKTAYDHSQSTHARTDASKVEDSTTNGNIRINDNEVNVYTHPNTNHIPAGGAANQILTWAADGTAQWADAPQSGANVTDSTTNGNILVDGAELQVYEHPNVPGAKHIPSGGSAGQVLKNNGSGTAIWADENKTLIQDSGTNGNITVDGQDLEVYKHPNYNSKNEGLYKFSVDSNGHIETANTIVKEDIVALGIPGEAPTVDENLSATSMNAIANKSVYTALNDKLDASLKGANNGIAELDINGKIPLNRLPEINSSSTSPKRSTITIGENTFIINIPFEYEGVENLVVYQNGLQLVQGIHYTATLNNITLIDYSAKIGDIFTFEVALTGLLAESEKIDNKTIAIDNTSTDEQYPSAKAVYDLFNSIVNANTKSY